MKFARITGKPNTLYYGDCLEIMQGFDDDWIDLICLDPPFNSDEKYNSVFRGSGMNIDPQVKAFDDTWTWNDTADARVENVKSASANPASKVIEAFETFIPRSKMLAYTSYMAERLFQMHRILKDTGSIYLHCDPYASHYLKLVMDAIFGDKNFVNEIVWKKTNSPKVQSSFYGTQRDSILFYTKDKQKAHLNKVYRPHDEKSLKPYSRNDQDGKGNYRLVEIEAHGVQLSNDRKHFEFKDRVAPYVYNLETLEKWDSEGRIYTSKNGIHRKKQYISDIEGVLVSDLWVDEGVPPIQTKESLGYPTQKPLRLYERIINASSNEGDLVLDPFCGCGTTIDAALKNRRQVIGIDILPYALRLINERRLGVELPVKGIPVSVETAAELAKSEPKGAEKFQDWAISLVDGLASNPQKVGDEGIDGFGMFVYQPTNMSQKGIIVQVTAANGSQKHKFDKLQSDVRSHNAAMGILITKDEQTAQDRWHVNLPPIEMGNTTYAPMQCFSIEEYYRNGKRYQPPLNLPPLTDPWTGKPMQNTLFSGA